MELKSRYKQTEIGVVPEDWSVFPFCELFYFFGGFTASRDQLGESGYCYLHYGDIHTSSRTYIDVEHQYSAIPKLDIKLNKVPKGSFLHDGDIVFVDASEDYEGTSKHLIVTNPKDIPFIAGLHTIVVRSKNQNQINNKYKRYCFQASVIKRQIRYYAVGTKVSGINKSTIGKILMAIPPYGEQGVIAEALSDVDVLIESLEQLIAKKRQIKQGVMQELLSGKRRLLGFSGDWEAKQLIDIADIRNGGTPSTFRAEFWDGGIPWCTPTDITSLKGYKYLEKTSRTISTLGLQNCSAELIPSKSIVMTTRATIGECAINQFPVATNQGFKSFIPSKGVDEEFLYYLLLTKKQDFIALSSGSTFLEISKKQLEKFKVNIPKERAEQTYIADVLSNMDEELSVLDKKLQKAQLIKQGMMHELLTGKIRFL